ncbi:uncharacterized protein TNCV_2880871 [Trichonephila clavipes]|nr:uncharacterized protein TNCV_2880871 [Trichonephila clavipes]
MLYVGDGDSKGFLTIKEAKVYGDTEVEKLECVGHVQKRMGTRLRNILKMSKGIKLSDGKNISGRGRLTLKEVDSIQHYYGLAIRKNLSSVEDMKRAIWAIYFHKLNTEDNPQHALCPLEKDLLKKCLRGRTQNPNESFNKCIWERIPKTVFVGIETLKFGVMDAVICFNDGYNYGRLLRLTPWYNRQAPGGALSIKADRVVQTTISRLASGHIRGLSFNLGQKIYENCTKCNLVQATPDHLLFCAGLEREDIYSNPLLVARIINTSTLTTGALAVGEVPRNSEPRVSDEKLAPILQTTTPRQQKDIELNLFNMHPPPLQDGS